MVKAIKEFDMIKDGEKVAVGLSGGKDSLALLLALKNYQQFSEEKFDLIAITIDQSGGRQNFDDLKKFCKETQFLIITHRKGTMEAGDSVYGVTMEENGVSKLLSIKAEENLRYSPPFSSFKTQSAAPVPRKRTAIPSSGA